jgi:hemoglobin
VYPPGACGGRLDARNFRAVARPSIYQAAGGEAAFLKLAAVHHRRCLEDPVLEHPFSHGVNPDHVERLAAYWAEVLGGPPHFTERYGDQDAMLDMHAGHGMEDELGPRFLACFLAAIDEVGIPDEAELRAALRAYMEWAVADVMVYAPAGATVTPGQAMPHWSWEGLQAS